MAPSPLPVPLAGVAMPSWALAHPRLARGLTQLRALPPKERFARVQRSRAHLRGLAAASALLDLARAALPAHVADSASWAECALFAAIRTRESHPEEDRALAACEVRAWGLLANARRASGDLRAADALFLRAETAIRHLAIDDRSLLAELRSYLGSLRRAQRRFDEAWACLQYAAETYRALQDDAKAARASVGLVSVLQVAGHSEQALEEVRRLSEPIADPYVAWSVAHSEVWLLLELGRVDEGVQRLAALRPQLLALETPVTTLRLSWLEARLALALGDLRQAEEGFRTTQQGFLAERIAYEAALVSLDLAVLLLSAGRYTETAELAMALVATFEGLEIGREALAAWRLFATAAARQEASTHLAHQLARFLDGARHDPELSFTASV